MWWQCIIIWFIFLVYILPFILIAGPIFMLILSWTLLKVKSKINKKKDE